MPTIATAPDEPLDAGTIIALGLLGAGLAIGTGTLLRTPSRRDACVRLMRDLRLPQIGREIAANVLLTLGSALTGHGAIDGPGPHGPAS